VTHSPADEHEDMDATTPPAARTGNVVVLDDEPRVGEMLSRLLTRAGYAVQIFSSPKKFLEEASLKAPCCLVLDVNMPELTGIEIQELLKRAEVPPAIVFMSGGSDVPTSVKAMKAGAVDFLAKPFANKDLLAAVDIALQRAAKDVELHAQVLAAKAAFSKLTPREQEVCQRVAQGLRSKDIAGELGSAVKTVNIHRSRIMAKLGVESVAELVRLVDLATR
jgi:FixJ family two-component response regulator